MVYNSCFDIIGPIMVGPSSSHTAGAVAIGKFVHDFLQGAPEWAEICFYDSFAETYRGHGTDKAIVGGLIGWGTDDLRIRESLKLAGQMGMDVTFRLGESCPYYDHPNTVIITAKRGWQRVVIGGASLGGGISTIFLINGHLQELPLNAPFDLDDIRNQTRYRIQENAGSEWAWTLPQ